MIDKLKNIDTDIFLALNGAHFPALDDIMYWASDKYFWIWFYVILLLLVVLKFKRKTIVILPIIAVLVLFTDQSSSAIKKSVKRYRPCHSLTIQNSVFVNGQCGGQYGFVSSHAANSFAIAVFLSLLLFKYYKWLPFLLFDWALLVCYSRIYNGVHYPADIFGGALLGIIFGLIFWRLYLYIQKTYYSDTVKK